MFHESIDYASSFYCSSFPFSTSALRKIYTEIEIKNFIFEQSFFFFSSVLVYHSIHDCTVRHSNCINKQKKNERKKYSSLHIWKSSQGI